jgi:DNA-binding MarR family transcriptional regulator
METRRRPAPRRCSGHPSDAAGEAWALVVELAMAHRGQLLAAAAEYDLSPMQAHVLRMLEPGTPIPMSALAEGLRCDASNVTGIVDRLEARRLIERRGAERDRRVKMLVVTDEGLRVRQGLCALLYAPPPAIARLSREDQRTLRDVLRRARALALAPV